MTQNEIGDLLGSGWTAQIFAQKDGRVLKLFEPWVPIEWINYEAKATQFAQQSGLPVPTIDGVISHKQRHGIIMERIDGPSMLTTILSRFWKTHYYARILAELQTVVNSKKAPELGPLRPRLDSTIRNEPIIPRETKSAVLRILENLPDGEAFCHCDLHPGNILMSPSGPIIIDWTGAAKGDPMADVARTWLLCTLPPLPGPFPIRRVLIAWSRHLYAEYLKEYINLSGIPQEKFDLWKIPILAARLSEEKTDARKAYLLSELQKRLVKNV